MCFLFELRKSYPFLDRNIFLFLLFATIVLLSSCVSYGRIVAPRIPVRERSLIELAPTLSLSRNGVVLDSSLEIENHKIMWIGDFLGTRTVLNLPAGTHSLSFLYSAREYTFISQYREEWIQYEGGAGINFDFKAGHHYKIQANRVMGEGENINIRLEVIDLGKSTSLFKNGIYRGTVMTMDMHLGSGGLSYVMLGMGFGFKRVVDIGTPIELSLNTGVDFGVGPGGSYEFNPTYTSSSPVGFPFGGFGGLFGHIYIPRTNFSIGAGYGYRAEIGVMSYSHDNFYSPFLRSEILNDGVGFYFEYYTNPVYLNTFEDPKHLRYADIYTRWGVGFFSRF